MHPSAAPLGAFGSATAEQRTIVMLMERMAALEDQVLADQRKIARLETRQLAACVPTYNVGRRVLWGCQISTGLHPVSCNFIALTDLGSDLVERALARRSGPLYEHIARAEYDRSNRMEPLASYLKARRPLGIGKEVVFINDVDVGMLVVHGSHYSSLFDVMEELHGILEEDDGDGNPLYTRHSINFNMVQELAVECVKGFMHGTLAPPALPVVPGGMEAALERYMADHGIVDDRRAKAIRDSFKRPWFAKEANGSTRIQV